MTPESHTTRIHRTSSTAKTSPIRTSVSPALVRLLDDFAAMFANHFWMSGFTQMTPAVRITLAQRTPQPTLTPA